MITVIKEMGEQLDVKVWLRATNNVYSNNLFQDINECTAGTSTCTANSTCENSDGSYTCPCSSGYSGDGLTLCTGMKSVFHFWVALYSQFIR